MTRQSPKKSKRSRAGKIAALRRESSALASIGQFDGVLAVIEAARRRAYQAVNAELVGLYWKLGEYISSKIASAEWGDGVVDELAATIAREYPGMRGYGPLAGLNVEALGEGFESFLLAMDRWAKNGGMDTSTLNSKKQLRRIVSDEVRAAREDMIPADASPLLASIRRRRATPKNRQRASAVAARRRATTWARSA